MPFNPDVKTRMFVRCKRFCCLCQKHCGINIEAAHIIDEAAGGSNEEDNGIPLCFDCHQEIGGYNNQHPKGNKFRPEELRARRDKIYESVEKGLLHARPANAVAVNPAQELQINAAVFIGPNGISINGPNAVVLGPNAINIVGPVVNNNG